MPPTLQIPTCLRAASKPVTAAIQQAILNPTTNPTIPRRRTLTTTARTLYKQHRVPNSSLPIPSVSAPHPEIPPYPYGPRPVYHQSNTGLYGSARIRFGNNVSTKNEIKTRRTWRPNVHHKNLWSESLGIMVRTRVTTRVLRTIDKVGGLDAYLLGLKPQRVKDLGPWGWRLRWRIMQTPAVRAQFAREREELGLPPVEEVGAEFDGGETRLPDGTVAGEALMAETDRMLAEEAEFGLGPEEGEDGFMREEEKPARQ
ncbi:hypothetical protein N657DRAFT_644922 [Parathielavia appendiculata]|uniref:Large ribosomal subunit protein bL28m n=1 Tax=Parathielavia appendiculata TaxID=2587402 RepID=A0AAN6U3Z5_9PEZI|nr:hypothetical protein N657DRAFT_644922 [Parathielavia appendiculata]